MSGNDETPICYTDCETLGLEPQRHDVFEVGILKVFPDGREEELLLWLPVDLSTASPDALRKNRFFERRRDCYKKYGVTAEEGAWKIAEFTSGAVLAGNRITFDEGMISAYLAKQKLAHAWELYTIDVPTFGAGALGLKKKFNGKTISELLGVPLPDDSERHTAMGDAKWARRMHVAAIQLVERREATLREGLVDLLLRSGASDQAPLATAWAQELTNRLRPQPLKVA